MAIYVKCKEGMPTVIVGKVENYNDFLKVLKGCNKDEVKQRALGECAGNDIKQFEDYIYMAIDDLRRGIIRYEN